MEKILPAVVERTNAIVTGDSVFSDTGKFELAQRVAKALSTSTMVPRDFQGNLGNCVIALNMADRMGIDPFMLMQKMFVIGGRPGIEAQLIIALINKSGMFQDPLRFKFQGKGETKSCTAYAYRKNVSHYELCEQTVTWAMVEAEGWNRKNGSKWQTLPDLMFQYRSAAFFGRIHCPEILLGVNTVDELEDIQASPLNVTPQVQEPTTAEKPVYNIQVQESPPAESVEVETPPEPPPPETAQPDEPQPFIAADFYRKRESTIRQYLEDTARIEATPQPILNVLWGKIEANGWNIDHPLYGDWLKSKVAEKPSKPEFKGDPADKIIDEPEKKMLKRIHANVNEKGLDTKGVKVAMKQEYGYDSSGDIKVGQVNDFINWLDELVPVNNLIRQIHDAEQIMKDAGKEVDLIAMSIEKVRAYSPRTTHSISHLYQLYTKPILVDWIIDNMDSWIAETPDDTPDEPEPEQKTIESKLIPEIKTVMDVVDYAATLAGISKANPFDPSYTQLAESVQAFITEKFGFTAKDLAAGLPNGIGEAFRYEFKQWFAKQQF